MKLEFSHQMLEKYLDIAFYEYPYGGSGIVTCGQTDRHTDRSRDERNSVFSQKLLTTEINLNYSMH